MSNLVGQQVSHYQIKAFLGSGRIGTVYQAIDLKDLSLVALKIIKLEFAKQPDVRRRFLEEIKSRPHLDHPGIIQVYEAGIDTQLDLLYMTMEFITGRSLTAYLQQLQFNKQRINIDEALMLIAEVAEALHYAHQQGLVHQDVRPNVILFKTDDKSDKSGLLPGHTAIGDFTLTTILEQEAELFAGSLPYLAPELFLAQGSDGRSDIYSLGIILYQLLTGRTPFSAQTAAEATRQHPYQDPPTPRSIRPDLPITIEDAVLKAIAKKPENRYQTGAEMAHALRQLADTLSTTASIPGEQPDISIVKTQPEPPDFLAIHSAWSTNEDRVTVTRDVPHSLNRQVVTVGRSESNDIVLPETSITRLHAQLERTQTGWQVRDLGSQNGTYLDGKELLPDIPEPWNSHQTLRIGPYFLHLQLGKGYDYQMLSFSMSVMPDKVEVHAGQQVALQVAIHNGGDNVDEFVLKMDRFPADWVTLPTDPIRLRPAEQTLVTVTIHPPKAVDILLGRHRYLLTVSSQTNERDKIAIPGVVMVLPAEERFSAQLLPTEIVGKGRMQLIVDNAGLMEKSFSITSPNPDNKLRLGMWQLKKLPETPTSTDTKTKKGGKQRPSSSLSSISNRLPFIRRLRSAPRQALARLQTGPRQAVNRILPGLGGLIPRAKVPSGKLFKSGKKSQTPAKKTPHAFPDNYKKLVFPDALYTQVNIPAGQEETVYLSVAPRKRPLWGRKNHLLPFEIAVSNGNGRQQTVTGQLEVKPRLRSTALTALLVLLILFACSFATYAYMLRYNPTILAMLSSPRDRDNDGLGNLAEVFVHQTNPNNPDSDNDTLSDAAEIADGLNPNRADTDGDGLDDAREQRINTNPRLADTDNDTLSDSWEVLQLGTNPLITDTLSTIALLHPTPSPTATSTPTSTPVPTSGASPAATISELVLTSRGQEDGHIVRAEGRGQPVFENETLQVGEGQENDQQFKGFLSFDTANIPNEAIIETATLRLYQISSAGKTANLGDLHVDIARVSGFNDNNALEDEDFSASAAIINTITLNLAASNEHWVTGALNETGRQALNRQGATQFRLYFTLPNNNDNLEDWVRFYAGDAARGMRPELIIRYKLPG